MKCLPVKIPHVGGTIAEGREPFKETVTPEVFVKLERWLQDYLVWCLRRSRRRRGFLRLGAHCLNFGLGFVVL